MEIAGKSPLKASEMVAPLRLAAGLPLAGRHVTLDDVFRETFIPLDCRKKVGNYVLGRTIGEGSFSKVRLARHVTRDQKVAIKVIPKRTVLKKQDARRRFMRETKALNKLRHVNLVQLLEVMETSGNYYLVIELILGTNFRHFLDTRAPVPEVEARTYMRQVADAVHYMHTMGIVHRDLKPDNFILQEQTIKIIDFGLSACLVDGFALTTQCGSPAYAAPEIFNQRPYTQSVDVWSIGIILCLVLTGCLPFTSTSSSYVHLYGVIMRGYAPPDWLSADAKDLISRVLQVDPACRITTADLLLHPWVSPPA